MANCTCASAIDAEMNDWIKLGGGNSGCCGNLLHTYGFHVPATVLPKDDYSRRHEAAVPYRMNWACAGDFHHGFNPKLMAMHAKLLSELMHGKHPMICEMITKPWANRPVYYWARWNGNGTLQRYTGRGHDHWSHISWWRSKANQRAYLWTPAPAAPAVKVDVSPGTAAPKYPGSLLKPGNKVNANVRVVQNQAHARGAKLKADGIFGPLTTAFIRNFQRVNRLAVDGIVGPKTWAALWNKASKMP